jgi:alanyl-tRNA synthetase
MTRTLYYEDPYLTSFTATIERVEHADAGGGAGGAAGAAAGDLLIVLDRTAFYPEGGGQPADIGTIGGGEVVDVQKRDGEIIHRVRGSAAEGADFSPPANGQSVSCEVDWDHRFDYMQQHTGQHVISGALMHVGDYPTVSVHQGEEYTTIEVGVESIPENDLQRIEERAIETVAADAEVRDYVVRDEEVPALELRRPPKVSGKIRIVEIDGYDRTACGGVHLKRTGQVGWIKLIDTERIRGRVRTVWKIGNRAVADYRLKTGVTSELTDLLSVQLAEIPERTRNLVSKLSDREWQIQNLRRRIAAVVADSLVAESTSAETAGPVVGRLAEEDADMLRDAAEHVVEEHGRPVALVAPQETRLRWCIGVPTQYDFDFNAVRGELLEPIAGKGGGKPPFWQGIAENPDGVDAFFGTVERILP